MALKSTGKFPRRDLAANRAYKMSEDRCECVFHAAYGRGTELVSFNRTWITERTFTARTVLLFDRRVAQNQWFALMCLKPGMPQQYCLVGRDFEGPGDLDTGLSQY